MPLVTATPTGMSNGDTILSFINSVGMVWTNYDFKSLQDKITIKNSGYANIQVACNGVTYTITPNGSADITGAIKMFSIVSNSGLQSFEVIATNFKDGSAIAVDNQVSRTLKKMYSGESTKIACYGDSLTRGIATPYPGFLQSRLQKIYDNTNITVVNLGTGGWTSGDGLANLSNVLAESPDLTIIMFGINDGNPVTNTSQETYRSNLTEMAKRLLVIGSEVILMSPTPIVKTENDRQRKLQTYAKVAQEVARVNNLPFIDMFAEISRLFMTKQEVPNTFYMDLVHFNDSKYAYIADIVVSKQLDYHNQTNILNITGGSETYVPLIGSPFIDTDISLTETNGNQFFQQNYVLTSDGSTGTKLRFQFYNSVAGMDISLGLAKTTTGGKLTIIDNGATVRTIDCFSNTTTAYDAEELLLENASVGYHCIELLSTNLVPGQSTNVSLGRCRPSYFAIRVTKKADDTVYNPGAGGFGSVERFRKLNDGVIRFANASGNSSGVVFSSKEIVMLKPSKAMIIEVDGKFSAGSGVSWFSNKTNGAQKITNGYMLYLGGTEIRLYNGNSAGLGDLLATYTVTTDFALTHKIRITHTDAGLITVFLNGTQIIQFTNAKDRTGWFGLHQEVNGNIEVTRYEYCYI